MTRRSRSILAGAGILILGTLGGCAAPNPEPTVRSARARDSIERRGDLVAMVDGQTVSFDGLRPALIESAGAQALRDAVVDLRLAARLRAAGIVIDADAITRERRILLATLDPDEARAESLLVAVRAREKLGDARFAALLARNAGLRALVAGGVAIDDAGVAAAHDILHGPRREVRIAVLASLADAERFAADLASRSFADLAVERSLDESAARGGLLAPFARRDPSYPEPVRAAAFATAVGATSAPVLDGARFHVLRVERERPADGVTAEASRAECERWLRLSRERLLMEALARELASMDGVTVFDRGFDGAAGPRP